MGIMIMLCLLTLQAQNTLYTWLDPSVLFRINPDKTNLKAYIEGAQQVQIRNISIKFAILGYFSLSLNKLCGAVSTHFAIHDESLKSAQEMKNAQNWKKQYTPLQFLQVYGGRKPESTAEGGKQSSQKYIRVVTKGLL